MNSPSLNAASLAHLRWDKTHKDIRCQAKAFYEINKPVITNDKKLNKAATNKLATLIQAQAFATDVDIRTIKNWIAKWENEKVQSEREN